MSATPEQIAERLDAWAEEEREAARYHEAGGSFSIMGACEAQEDKLRAAAALIRAQAERVRVLEARVASLEATLKHVLQTLCVPAAEYVPAIRDCFDIIDAALNATGAPE